MADRRARSARRAAPRSRHLLRSTALAAEIVRASGVGPGDTAVDLGAGTGRLTEPLARAAARVIAVELDGRLAASLHGRWRNVEVVEGDAATTPLPATPFRVVANLPFDRTSDILHHLLDDPRRPLLQADLIVEWGVAVKRGLPKPSTVNGVVWGAWFEMTVARRLARTCFEPPPSVDAGLLVIRRRTEPLVPVDLAEAYRRFVAHGFRHGLGAGPILPRDLDAHRWAHLFLRMDVRKTQNRRNDGLRRRRHGKKAGDRRKEGNSR